MAYRRYYLSTSQWYTVAVEPLPANKMNEITIRRLRDVQKIDTYFASTMVDIAYIKSKGNDYIKVEPEDGIDLNNDNDRAWLRDLLEQALSECKETNAEIVFN